MYVYYNLKKLVDKTHPSVYIFMSVRLSVNNDCLSGNIYPVYFKNNEMKCHSSNSMCTQCE